MILATSAACSAESSDQKQDDVQLAITAKSDLGDPTDTGSLVTLLQSEAAGRLKSEARQGAWEFWDEQANHDPKRLRIVSFSKTPFKVDGKVTPGVFSLEQGKTCGSVCAPMRYSVYEDASEPNVFGISIEDQSFLYSKHEVEAAPGRPGIVADAYHFRYADNADPCEQAPIAFILRRYRRAP